MMFRALLVILCLTICGRAQQQPKLGRMFWPSVGARVASFALDSASSRGKRELNPLFRNSEGRFSAGKHAAFNLGTIGASVLIAKKWPKASRVLACINFTFAGVQTGVAVRNFGIEPRRIK